MVIAKIKIVSNALYSYPAADLTCHWRSIQQRTFEASYQYRPTLGALHNDVFNFVFLDCTISHFGLHKLHLGLHKLVGLHA